MRQICLRRNAVPAPYSGAGTAAFHRNTRPIAEAFGPLTPMRMYARGGGGPEVSFVEAAAEDALDVADDQIDPLLDEGWRPEDVALLTTGARHQDQVALQESEGQDGYWQTLWDKDCVFYGNVLGCKGLERKVVVLCVTSVCRGSALVSGCTWGFRGRQTSSSSLVRQTSSAKWVDRRWRRSLEIG